MMISVGLAQCSVSDILQIGKILGFIRDSKHRRVTMFWANLWSLDAVLLNVAVKNCNKIYHVKGMSSFRRIVF